MSNVSLEQINSPADLRRLDRRELKELADQLRQFILSPSRVPVDTCLPTWVPSS